MRKFNSRIYGMMISSIKSLYYKKCNGEKEESSRISIG